MQSLIKVNSEIRSARLTLRPLRTSDAGRLFDLFNNWNVVRYLALPPWPYARSDAEGFINGAIERSSENQDVTLAITFEDDLIGGIGAPWRPAAATQRAPGPHIAYWLGEPHWGHGYMTEAANALISRIFATWEGDTIYSGVFTENAASLRVQEKLGFTVDGETQLYSRPRGGHFRHVNTALTRERFRQFVR